MILIILSAFILGFAANIIATGPATFLVLKEALIRKYKKAAGILFGASAMEVVYCTFGVALAGIVIQYLEKIRILSQGVNIIILLILGIYFLKTNPEFIVSQKTKKISNKEHAKAFFLGSILVAMNPTPIFTWAAASATLNSLGFIQLVALPQIIVFIVSAVMGSIIGGLAMILFVRSFHKGISEKIVSALFKTLGIIILLIAFSLSYSFFTQLI